MIRNSGSPRLDYEIPIIEGGKIEPPSDQVYREGSAVSGISFVSMMAFLACRGNFISRL